MSKTAVEDHGGQNKLNYDPYSNHTLDSVKSEILATVSTESEFGYGPRNPVYYKETLSSCIPMPELTSEESKVSIVSKFVSTIKKVFGLNKPEPKIDLDPLLTSVDNKIKEVQKEIVLEMEENDDPQLSLINELSTEISSALQAENLDWKKLDLLIRQLSVLIHQQMVNSDQKMVQQELQLLEQDIKNVRKTYNTPWQLTLGLTMGVVGIAGGLVGMGGGVAGIAGAISQSSLTSLKSFIDGVSMLNQGLNPINSILRDASESKRQLYQFELERNRSHKSVLEASQQAARNAKSGQLSSINSAIDAAYRAFLSLAGG